jgi:uncharacterized membrane protein YkvA (DUF1232 family)
MTHVRILPASEVSREPCIRAMWDRLLDQNTGVTLFYESPEYFDHLAQQRADCAFLAIVEADDGEPIGIVPIRKSPVSLKFELGKYYFADASLPGVRILGGAMLAPQSRDVFALVFRKIAQVFPDCDAVEVAGLPTTSILWEFLRHNRSLNGDFTLYVPDGARVCHRARVPASYADYLGSFRRKKQYNLKRQIRRLDHFGNGSLTLHRIERASDVKYFQDACISLGCHARRGGALSETEMLDLAERGLLLSYVLSVNGKPCALAFGTRFRDTLILHHFGHDVEIGHLSPGTVLQTLMMRDLAEHKLARIIDYGFGEPRYRLTNELDTRASVIMVRRGLLNECLIGAHSSYSRLVNGIKRVADPLSKLFVGAPVQLVDRRARSSAAAQGWRRRLARDAKVLITATVDHRVPWRARFCAVAVAAAYVIAPIDPIPNRFSIIGHFDDLIIAALTMALFIRLVPRALLEQLRADLT